MNEFIVWDKRFKIFIEPSHKIVMTTKDGLLKGINGGSGFVEDWEAFNYIGRKDINDKKIYADCSIVEFDFYIDDSFGWMNWRSLFTYDCGELCFNILIDGKLKRFSYISPEIRNIKIIGTIQENPELLEVSDEQ